MSWISKEIYGLVLCARFSFHFSRLGCQFDWINFLVCEFSGDVNIHKFALRKGPTPVIWVFLCLFRRIIVFTVLFLLKYFLGFLIRIFLTGWNIPVKFSSSAPFLGCLFWGYITNVHRTFLLWWQRYSQCYNISKLIQIKSTPPPFCSSGKTGCICSSMLNVLPRIETLSTAYDCYCF